MNEKAIFYRRQQVYLLARKYGYQKEQAEDIAQDAALALIENPNLSSQTPNQAFVDAMRSGSVTVITRYGKVVQPIYENQFGDFKTFSEKLEDEANPERELSEREDLTDFEQAVEMLRNHYRKFWQLRYEEGLTADQIADRFDRSPAHVFETLKQARVLIKESIRRLRANRAFQKAEAFREREE